MPSWPVGAYASSPFHPRQNQVVAPTRPEPWCWSRSIRRPPGCWPALRCRRPLPASCDDLGLLPFAAMKGFRDFLLRGNLIELAVAFIMGVAFAAVVEAFTKI